LQVADFLQASVFTREWDRLGLSDDDLRELELMIMSDPKGNPVIQGTGGLRKIRFSPASRPIGKSGTLRACYVYFQAYALVYLVIVYEKGRKDDLSADEKKTIKNHIAKQDEEFSKRFK
jgi:hypothetical protein